jgi:hypothetical protein
LRHTRSAARAGAAGFLWGTVIAATVAAFLAFTSTSLSVYGSRWEEKVIGKWSYVTLFAAPYVALWLGVYSWWVWRRAAVTGTSLDSAHSHRVKIPAAG